MNDLTVGSPWKKIILFALPLLGSSLLQQLYSTVDLIFVGRFIGKEAAAAVGSSDLLVTCMVGLFTGISIGSNVVAAQAFGSGDKNRLHRLIQTVFFFGIAGAAVILAVGLLMAPVFLNWMNTPEEIHGLATTYLRIYFLSTFSLVLYNLGSGIVRAVGDSVAAFRFQMFGGLMNIVADFVFIYLFQWGVAGAAIATFASQTLAMLLTIRYLTGLERDIALRITKPSLEFGIIKHVLQIGIPSGIQSMVITFSNILVQSVINGYGVDTIAAFVAYFKVELFLWYPIVALGQALVTFTAQNIGAGEEKRVYKGLRVTLFMGTILCVLLAMLLLALAHPVFGLFNTDPDVVNKSIQVAKITFPIYFIYLFQESFSAVLKGKGQAMISMIIIIGSMCLFRIIILFVFTACWHTIQAIAVVYPLSWFVAGVGMAICLKMKKATS